MSNKAFFLGLAWVAGLFLLRDCRAGTVAYCSSPLPILDLELLSVGAPGCVGCFSFLPSANSFQSSPPHHCRSHHLRLLRTHRHWGPAALVWLVMLQAILSTDDACAVRLIHYYQRSLSASRKSREVANAKPGPCTVGLRADILVYLSLS